MDDRNLIKAVTALVTICLMACSFWYYAKNRNGTKTSKIGSKNKNTSAPEKLNRSTILAKDETSHVSFQDGSVSKISESEDSDVMIKYSQASCQEQDGAKIEYSGILPQERGANTLINSLNSSSIRLAPETISRTTYHKVDSINAHKPEVNGQPKNYEEISENHSNFLKTDANTIINNLNSSSIELAPETTNQTTYHKVDSINAHKPEVNGQPENYEEISENHSNFLRTDANTLINNLNSSSIGMASETTSQTKCHKVDSAHEPEVNGQPENNEEISENHSNFLRTDANILVNNLNSSSIESAPETTNQTTYHKVDSINAHEPEVNGQPENNEEISENHSNFLKTDANTLINNLNSSSIELAPETTNQTTHHKVDSINAHEPEVNRQLENYEEIPENHQNFPKTDSPIMQTGFNHTTTPKTESDVSSQSGEESETESCPSLNKDACVQTEPQISRSIILNDQLPISIPLPNETASDMLNEFRCSNAVHAFTGQDLIELEDYDEEEEIRRFLFRKNSN